MLSLAYVIGGLILLFARNRTFMRDYYDESAAPAPAAGA
jgi:hypothetical protein